VRPTIDRCKGIEESESSSNVCAGRVEATACSSRTGEFRLAQIAIPRDEHKGFV
jgi:hypothetical protein